MLTDEYEEFKTYQMMGADWVSLLAFEDPSLKGYYESRKRYVDDSKYNLLFNQIGEVRAGIMHRGKAVGVWAWDKKQKRINVDYFTKVDNKTKTRIDDVIGRYEIMLYPTQQLTIYDSEKTSLL
jgi:hypothetical protein